jgi:hypothetical protein
MLRAIIKREYSHGGGIPVSVGHETIEFECSELESVLRGGGCDRERGTFDFRSLVDVEIVCEEASK